MICEHEGCGKFVEPGRTECFRHRVATVGFSLRGPAVQGDFHTTVNDWKLENLGTTSDRELAERGIERMT